MPYSLRFTVTVGRLVPGSLVETEVSGDLEGPARLEVEADGRGSTARLVWTMELCHPALRAAALVARPLLEWGHEWVVDNGMRQFVTRALPPAAGA